jgi:hypothetical protein
MSVPFTFNEFLEMLERFNTDLWPAHAIMYALAGVAIYFAIRKSKYAGKIVTVILVLFWIWVGVVFNLLYFSMLNPMAYLFVVLFILEGIMLAMAGLFKNRISFKVRADLFGLIGAVMIIYALIGYPLVGYVTGRGPDHLLYTGMMPCPTTIFTLGILCWTDRQMPKYILIIPVIYALSGFVPVGLGVIEDIGLIVAGIVTALLFTFRERFSHRNKEETVELI